MQHLTHGSPPHVISLTCKPFFWFEINSNNNKQFDHAPDLHSSYQKIIDEYESDNIIERVLPIDVGEPGKGSL